ncbi:MAG: alpha/beta hydrolase [Proteobacteria bacterium]|nr:alpha/beta hydrolase [Burkholderiales bacterium]
MFEGFTHTQIQTSDPDCRINLRHGGKGPAVLLLHGNPLTHVTWHLIAPRLAERYTVVCTDLRGYGDSDKPRGLPDHTNYSFRRMAQDQVDVMKSLGFDEFMVVGHDRGARTAHRMALDHPDKVKKFASIEIIPTHWQLTNMKWTYAAHSYHWFFFAQPFDFPEKLLEGKEEYYIRRKFAKQGEGKFSAETMAEYVRCCTPEHIHGMSEDYRATLSVDFPMDVVDWEAGKRVTCPTLVMWAEKSHTQREFSAVDAWPHYATDIRGFHKLSCAHYPMEEAPEETYKLLADFLDA